MGHRNSRSLNQNSRSDRRQDYQASSPSTNKLREDFVSPSAMIEAVVMLDEPTSGVEALVSTGVSGDAAVCGELALTQTEWMTDVTPLEFSVADDEPARDIERSVAPLLIPDRSRELADLQQQVGAKDELISALVGELEQVVEQLDRMQRTGSNRSQSSSGGVSALPAEVVEEHQQVLGDLQRVVQQWDSLQASSVLGRIEAEVGELRAMMARGAGLSAHGESLRRETTAPDGPLDDDLSRLASDRQVRSLADTDIEGTSWESMKRKMMGIEEPVEAVAATIDEVEEVNLDSVVAPRPVDLDGATRDELWQACTERDAYIVQLARMLRSRRTVSLPANWDDIVDVPEEQKARVHQLTARLEGQVRLAEVEMSLERARLSRERTQLQTEREKIEKQLKRLGLTSLDELETVAVENGSNSDRRWMRFLGVNRRS